MNILYIGLESSNWVINLCNNFCNKGHKVTCVVQGLDEYDKENPIERHKNLEVIYIPYETFLNPLEFRKQRFYHFIDKNFDVIFGSHVFIAPVVQLLGETLGKPWGLMLLDIPTHLMRVERQRMKSWSVYFDILKRADAIIFNNHVARDEYERYTGIRLPDSCVITYGTNLIDKFQNSGIDKKGDYIISVCRLISQKNCSLIPKALGLINCIKKYVAVGIDQGELEYIKRLCELHNIEFVHYDNVTEKKKFELIRDSAMMVYPQNTEFIGGLSPWEGMFVGKPVVVSRLKVLSDLYKENAVYFENDNSLSLAKEISFLYNIKPELTRPLREKASEFTKHE